MSTCGFRLRRIVAFIATVVFTVFLSSGSEAKPAQSSGLKASIGRIAEFGQGPGRGLAIQLLLENLTGKRIYLFVTGDERAALSDGKALSLVEVIGVTYCRVTLPQERATSFCIQTHEKDLGYYSYIDGGGQIDLSLRYRFDDTRDQTAPEGSLSFRLILVTRVANAEPGSLEAEANPKSIAPPSIVILNFPLTLLKPNGG